MARRKAAAPAADRDRAPCLYTLRLPFGAPDTLTISRDWQSARDFESMPSAHQLLPIEK